MEIYELKVTSNFFEQLDEQSCHIELDKSIRCVFLSDTDYKTIEELKQAVETLNFN